MKTKTSDITTEKCHEYNQQLKKERTIKTLKVVKGLMTAIALAVALVCLFLMIKAK